jgi:hypothetical protein
MDWRLEFLGLAWGLDENTLRDAFGSFGNVTEGIALISSTFSYQLWRF